MSDVMSGNGKALGGLLGIANVMVIVAVAGVTFGANPYEIMWVCAFGALPGLLLGITLGAVATKLCAAPVHARLTLLLTGASLCVLVLASITRLDELSWFALVPTAIATLILERFTRQRVSAEAPLSEPCLVTPPETRNAPAEGLTLGIGNVVVVAFGLDAMGAARYVHGAEDVVLSVIILGALPGAITGAVLGAVAHRYRHAAVSLRRAVIIVPALLVVVALATITELTAVVLPTFVPTVCAALILERRTRSRLLPIAHARPFAHQR
jgi:hypothetical protein